jgi:hypothetical protein
MNANCAALTARTAKRLGRLGRAFVFCAAKCRRTRSNQQIVERRNFKMDESHKLTLFRLGQVVATPGALMALERAGDSPHTFLERLICGDWGELGEDDRQENALSLEHSFRLLSAYQTTAGEKLWVITEANRTLTTILLPDEY